MRDGYDASPMNPLPPVVWALVLPVVAMEAVLAAGGAGLAGGPGAVGWRLDAIQRFAFSGEILRWMWATGQWPAEHLIRFASYPFVHGTFTHALFVVVFLLALGKMVAEVFRAWAVLVVFFAAAFAGAMAHAALGVPQPLIGGYPAVYGLIGAFTFILWARLGAVNANRARAFTLIGFLLGIQLIFALIFGNTWDWVADIAGFVAGFALSFVVSPGGWSALRDRIRHR